MEKRAFTRREVRLEGICSAPGKGTRVVEIRDFCPGGMLLSYDPPATGASVPICTPLHGDIIHIMCTVPAEGREHKLVFQGRVVRIDDNGAGLAFINPNLDALHLLTNYGEQERQTDAQYSPAASAPSKSPSPQIDSIRAKTLILACKKLTLIRFDSLLTTFLQTVTERLFNHSGVVQSMPEKNVYLDAFSIFNKNGVEFKRDFIDYLEDRLDHVNPIPQVNSLDSSSDASEKTLSLIEEDVFAEWLALSDLSRRVELECRETLTDLNFRMSALFRIPVNKDNNPFGINAISSAFQQALKSLKLNPSVLQITYGSFRDLLMEALRELYDELNRYLVENGVLPDLRYKYKIKPAKSSGPNVRAISNAWKRSGSVDQIPESNRDIAGARAGPSELRSALDWYNLVQNLDTLQKQAAWQSAHANEFSAGGRATPITPPATSPTTTEFYTSEELMFALSRINFSGKDRSFAGDPEQNVKAQLLSVLSEETGGVEPKQLPYREEKILDVTQNLFHSVLNDKLISNNVRPWLQQLTGPLFKMAMLDDAVFSDKTHLVRQVINNIAQLEFYGEGDQNQNAVTKRVNELLAQVAAAENTTPETLERVLKELNLFIRLQNKAYKENLKEVIDDAEEAQQQGKFFGASGSYAARTSVLAQNSVPGMPEKASDALREWKKRVLRMRVGTALMLTVDSEPRRLKLAWIAKQLDRYVFVNVKGLKEMVLSPDEIAHQLYSGTAAVLDDDEEPLLDRAQYSMLQKMHHELLHETTHDHLTGLINRREFEHRLSAALASARQDNLQHNICYLDLDQFSIVNNTFGYDGGDRLLIEIAQILAAEVGAHGVLARIGGDEFGILFENCTQEEALGIMSRQKAAVLDYRFVSDKKSLSVSFSAGLVAVSSDSDSVAALFQAAESSCRIARGKGTNYIQVFNPADSELVHHDEIIKWVTRIDEALDQNTLELRYQIIAEISEETLVSHHAEILLSVVDETGRLISPAEFVLAAEHFRRMATVDRWVIERAFHWMVENSDRLAEIGGLAINLSGSSLNEEGFAEFILALAQEMRVPMQHVCFEITETAGIANLSNASDFILNVKKSGCTFALDDFGSGLSSYAYLKNLPVDFLKIDGEFVKNMDENPYDYAVVKSITEIGHFMGKKIIAEYVEKDSVLAMLREIGVDYGQGYAIAKPQALESNGGPAGAA